MIADVTDMSALSAHVTLATIIATCKVKYTFVQRSTKTTAKATLSSIEPY